MFFHLAGLYYTSLPWTLPPSCYYGLRGHASAHLTLAEDRVILA